MRLCLVVFCCLLVSACSGRINLSDGVTAGSSTLGALVSSAVGLPPAGVAAVTLASGVGGATLVDNNVKETIGEVCAAVPNDMRVECVKEQAFIRAIKDWGLYAIYATLGFFIITFMVGYFLPNGKQRRLMKKAIDHPDIKSTDI